MTEDEDEAFPRQTQDSAKGRSCCRRSKGTDRGVTEPRLPKKVENEGSGRTIGGMDQQDSTRRAWKWNLGIRKWVTCPHASTCETQSMGEDRRVEERG